MTIKIEKNVPVPSYAGKYPLSQMEIGDSFVVNSSEAKCLRSTVAQYSKKESKKFLTKTIDGNVRAWRVA